MKKQRNTNIELLRIICMLMIITLHYFYQGAVLETITYGDKNYGLVWLIESVCYISVNCYVLISGWFLTDVTKINVRKIALLIGEAVFYSVGIYLVFCLLGETQLNIKTLVTGYVFPIIHGEYWFVTCYVVLLLAVPYLNRLLNTLEKHEMKRLLLIMGSVFSVIPTVVFFAVDTVGIDSGYSFIWFVYLYFVSAYLKRYGLNLKKWHLGLVAAICCVLPFFIKMMQQMVLHNELWNWYHYNSLPVLVASAAVFYLVALGKPKHDQVLNGIAGTTFGVFLIHTQFIMRDEFLWDKVVKPLEAVRFSSGRFVCHIVISVITIFAVCSIIDGIRKWLTSLLIKNG